MKIEWLYEARGEYREILTYYKANVGRKYAKRISEKIRSAVKMLEQYPEAGVLKRNTFPGKYDFRALFIEQYVMIYRIEGECVRIYHLADARSNYLYNIFGGTED